MIMMDMPSQEEGRSDSEGSTTVNNGEKNKTHGGNDQEYGYEDEHENKYSSENKKHSGKRKRETTNGKNTMANNAQIGRRANFPNIVWRMIQHVTANSTSTSTSNTSTANSTSTSTISTSTRHPQKKASAHSNSCLAWTEGGMAFDVFDSDVFMERIAPKFFPQQSKFRSFQRQLNSWGWVKTSPLGKKHYRFAHIYFQRDKPELKRLIQRDNNSIPVVAARFQIGLNTSTTHTNLPDEKATTTTTTSTTTRKEPPKALQCIAKQINPRPPSAASGKEIPMVIVHRTQNPIGIGNSAATGIQPSTANQGSWQLLVARPMVDCRHQSHHPIRLQNQRSRYSCYDTPSSPSSNSHQQEQEQEQEHHHHMALPHLGTTIYPRDALGHGQKRNTTPISSDYAMRHRFLLPMIRTKMGAVLALLHLEPDALGTADAKSTTCILKMETKYEDQDCLGSLLQRRR